MSGFREIINTLRCAGGIMVISCVGGTAVGADNIPTQENEKSAPAAANSSASNNRETAFLADKLTYSKEQRSQLATALASLQLDFPEKPGVRSNLRERTAYLAIVLDPDNVEAKRSIASLLATRATAEDAVEPTKPEPPKPKPTGQFKGTEELGIFLVIHAKPIGTTGATFDDLVLSTHLLDIASKIDPANKDARDRVGDLRAAGHHTRWDLILPPAKTNGLPDPPGISKPGESPDLPAVNLSRWKSAVPAFALRFGNGRRTGSTLSLASAMTVVRETQASPQTGAPQPAVKNRGNKQPMQIHMVEDGAIAWAGIFADVEELLQKRYSTWPNDRDIEIKFERGYPNEFVPMQEAACTLLVDSLLSGRRLDGSVIAHADLDERGNLVPVDRLITIISEAATKLRVGQTMVVGRVDEKDLHDTLALIGPNVFLTVDIIAAKNFSELVEIAESPQLEKIHASRRLFRELQIAARKYSKPENFLKTVTARKRLTEILKLMPNHVSATALLLYSTGRHAREVSFEGAFEFTEWTSGPVIYYSRQKPNVFRQEKALQIVAGRLTRIRQIRPKVDRTILPYIDTLLELGEVVIDYGAMHDLSSKVARAMAQRGRRLASRFQALRTEMESRIK